MIDLIVTFAFELAFLSDVYRHFTSQQQGELRIKITFTGDPQGHLLCHTSYLLFISVFYFIFIYVFIFIFYFYFCIFVIITFYLFIFLIIIILIFVLFIF